MRNNPIMIFWCIIFLITLLAGQSTDAEFNFDLDYPCSVCHSTNDWNDLSNSLFNHDLTEFKLTGIHKEILCSDCHTGDDLSAKHDFSSVSVSCASCHTDVHYGTRGSNCQNCHSPQSWFPDRETFFHERSAFPLTGSHSGLSCDRCHSSSSSEIIPPINSSCNSCHVENYLEAAASIPDHDSFNYSCEFCHKPDSWQESAFVHSTTSLPLEGQHQKISCNDCHFDGYLSKNGDCYACHLEIYDQTTDPVHADEVYLFTDCAMCHNANSWDTSIYDHLPEPDTCTLCHLSSMLSANMTIPGHNSLPNQCRNCHTTNTWDQIDFDHSITSYDLEGIHQVTDCRNCHISGFAQTAENCVDCHLDDYNNAQDPVHDPIGFNPDNCDICHTPLGWEPAVFHNDLAAGNCADCHDYNGLSDPLPEIDHLTASKLGQDIDNCTLCHSSTSEWQEISFSENRHDGSNFGIYFDIYSGEHNNKWGMNCTDNCHVFNAFDTFSCYDNCHENKHSRSKMNNEHCEGSCESCTGNNGYWLVSQQYSDGNWQSSGTFLQCYECHPNGDKSGGCGDDSPKPFYPKLYFDDSHKKENISK